MKNIINYYYNLFPEDIKNRYGGGLFEIESDRFILTELSREPQEIIDIYETLIKNNIGNYIIIYNKDGKTVTIHDNKNYILYKIRCLDSYQLGLNETFGIKAKGKSLWSKLWSDRIDYYEIQINELGQEKHVILQSVYYYIGLAENAIFIAGKLEKELNEDDYAIQHFRMNVPIIKGEYFNPNNMLVDISVRDIAEYVKSSFFYDTKEVEDYIEYILSLSLDTKKANLLLARLLYPTYYFDLFDEIILNEREEDDLIPVIKLNQKYEDFIVYIYEELVAKYNIIHIEWIKKRIKIPH